MMKTQIHRPCVCPEGRKDFGKSGNRTSWFYEPKKKERNWKLITDEKLEAGRGFAQFQESLEDPT